jgi:hypothetical protein
MLLGKADLKLHEIPRWLEKWDLHFNRRRPSYRGFRHVRTIVFAGPPSHHISVERTLGGLFLLVQRDDASLDCIAELLDSPDARVHDLLDPEKSCFRSGLN